MAALRGVSRTACSLPLQQLARPAYATCSRRSASTQAAEPASSSALLDLETESTLAAPQLSPEEKKEFRPWKRAADRKLPLPGSRYQYHPPKYDRGPLHPIQSPATSDPIARDFVPGPFHLPRLRQTHQSTISSDLMTLTYNHVPSGTPEVESSERLRSWDDSSPYHLNRPKRAPRGAPVLPLRERNITFRNIPEIKEVTIAAYSPEAQRDPSHLVVARSVILALTGSLPEITTTNTSVVQWSVVKGKRAGVKTTIYANDAYEFLDRLIHMVFPRIKDWKGVKATTGDGSGNLAFGLGPQEVAMFPEVEVNYDMFPTRMIPGCRIFVKTTATSDRQARLLLQCMGVPFYGKMK
ncbi:ribosomal protein L5 domain-containing protein [Cercophora newfieldiana]|uniref:Ribosomal protein L5 domain-containing protein n=1 Tax=Cercophora newfieldiana TaxID=92897 RepID=A0AA40CVL0_9PEZI|nr:ribosomal protein L5 domain-containing protein [Cercophora newfieldiana]